MKSIKAFVRATRVDEVVRALKAAGAPGITMQAIKQDGEQGPRSPG